MADSLNDELLPDVKPGDGVGLCLSGGGYRAMLFHVGSLWRLCEAGVLGKMTRISSVSGGSIAAGALALAWDRIQAEGMAAFQRDFVAPVRALAGHTVDVKSVFSGLITPSSIGEKVAGAYDKYLFHGRTLQDLPDAPRFIFNATNLETGSLFRFSKPYARDYRVGQIVAPRFGIAQAVAASSAFPPVLSPFVLKVKPADFAPREDGEIADDAFRHDVALTDGGVYDNMGIEPIWKSCATLFVSDGGARIADDPTPHEDWARMTMRVLDLIDHQVRNLRKRQVVGSLADGARKGGYWGIRTDIADYGIDSLPVPHAVAIELAQVPTRLAAMEADLQERLINWGYAVCDAALRRYHDPAIPKGGWPYPAHALG